MSIQKCGRLLHDTISLNLIQLQTDRLELKFTGDTICQIDGEKYNGFAEGEKKLLVNVVSSCDVIVPWHNTQRNIKGWLKLLQKISLLDSHNTIIWYPTTMVYLTG